MSHYSGSRAKSKRKRSASFTPSRDQIETAKRRILCALNTYDDGKTPVMDFDDAVEMLCGKVYNRANQLGATRRELRKTIRAALMELIYDEKKVEVNAQDGVIRLTVKVESKRRRHQQRDFAARRTQLRYA